MIVDELLAQLNNSGIVIRLKEDGDLAVTAPKGAMNAEIAGQIKHYKNEIVAFLNNGSSNGNASSLPPIKPIERGEYLPVSPEQERLWRVEQLVPGTAVYNLPSAFRLKGLLNVPALERSLQWTIQRHEGLRVQFQNMNGQLLAQIINDLPDTLPIVTLDTLPADERENKLQQLLQEYAQIPFDLANGPLFRITLFRLTPDEHVLLFLVHHIIFDGWSADILWQDLVSAYKAADEEALRPPLSIQYADYAAWRRDWLSSQAAAIDLQFWKEKLQSPVEALSLPVSQTANNNQSFYEAQEQKFTVSAELTSQIKMLARKEKVTPYMVLLAAYKASLHAYSGQKDMIVCSPIVGRMMPVLESLIGYFNNIVVLRTSLTENPTFTELLGRVRQAVLTANNHQTIPFQQVAELPNVSNIPLMRSLFVLQDSVQKLEPLPGISTSPVSIDQNFDYVDLFIEFIEKDNELTGTLSFKTALFDPGVIQLFIENFLATLSNVVGNPMLSLSELPQFDMPAIDLGISDSNEAAKNERPFTLPRDEVESQLASIWGNLLNYEPVSVHDDFFEVGGHSLLAIRFFDQIEEITERKLPLALLFEAPTIAELANIIQDDTWEATKSSIVAISGSKQNQETAQRPFYCIIPPGDELLVFNDVAKEIGNERPFMGLQYGVHGETPITTVEEMAAYFVEQITPTDHSEPFLLGGYCFGGLIAYEMAQQLTARGHQVGLVVLIDSNVPGAVWQLPNTVDDILAVRLKNIKQNLIQKKLVYTWGRITDIWKLRVWQPIWQKVHKRYVNTGRKWPEILRDFVFINDYAANNYQVKPYHGAVILLQAKDRAFFTGYLPHLGWEEYVKGDFTDHFVSGSHETLLRGSNAEALAQEVKTALTAVTIPKTY
jgi:thioesterase domain-containing protein